MQATWNPPVQCPVLAVMKRVTCKMRRKPEVEGSPPFKGPSVPAHAKSPHFGMLFQCSRINRNCTAQKGSEAADAMAPNANSLLPSTGTTVPVMNLLASLTSQITVPTRSALNALYGPQWRGPGSKFACLALAAAWFWSGETQAPWRLPDVGVVLAWHTSHWVVAHGSLGCSIAYHS